MKIVNNVQALFGLFKTLKSPDGSGVTLADNVSVTGTLSVAGATAFSAMPTFPTSTVAAAGTNQATATEMGTGIVLVTAADATKGVKLPAAAAGKMVIVLNGAAAVLKLYPGTGDTINGGAANAEYTGGVAANTPLTLVAYDDTAWYSLPLADS